ncbi:MAG: hypothetical protein ABW068_13905 [Candidatus Thiodiazotropha sp.]
MKIKGTMLWVLLLLTACGGGGHDNNAGDAGDVDDPPANDTPTSHVVSGVVTGLTRGELVLQNNINSAQ